MVSDWSFHRTVGPQLRRSVVSLGPTPFKSQSLPVFVGFTSTLGHATNRGSLPKTFGKYSSCLSVSRTVTGRVILCVFLSLRLSARLCVFDVKINRLRWLRAVYFRVCRRGSGFLQRVSAFLLPRGLIPPSSHLSPVSRLHVSIITPAEHPV